MDNYPEESEHMKDKTEEITHPKDNQDIEDNINNDTLRKK